MDKFIEVEYIVISDDLLNIGHLIETILNSTRCCSVLYSHYDAWKIINIKKFVVPTTQKIDLKFYLEEIYVEISKINSLVTYDASRLIDLLKERIGGNKLIARPI